MTEANDASCATNPACQSDQLVCYGLRPGQEAEIWETIAQDCGLCDDERLQLQSGLQPYVRFAILETEYVCKDHRNLHRNFYAKRFRGEQDICQRLHFFDQDPSQNVDLDTLELFLDEKVLQQAYIGFCVIRPISKRALGRMVIDPSKIGRGVAANYYTVQAEFKVHLGGLTLLATGYPYMAQDAEAIVCAHVALWGVCRYLSQRYSIYREIYPYDFISLTSAYRGRAVPYRGMTYADFSEILTRFGCHPVIIHQPNPHQGDYEDIYAYVESGFPTLASSGAHVVTIIGHSLKRDSNVTPDMHGLINSMQFVDSWVVVDDNVFPYQKLQWKGPDPAYGQMYQTNNDPSTDFSFSRIENIVVPLPERVFLTADRAAQIMQDYILATRHSSVAAKLEARRKGAGLVTRLFVTTGTALKREALRRYREDQNNILADIIEMPLPHFVWVMELASVTGYCQDHKCLGEIVLDATATKGTDGVLYARVKNYLLIRDEEDVKVGTGSGEYSQFSHNLSSDRAERGR